MRNNHPQHSLLLLFPGILFLLWPLYTNAKQADSVWFSDFTWTELADKIRHGDHTIIIPIGGTEQSGPFIAVGKHNIRVKRLSEQIAYNVGSTLVAPVVAYVPEGNFFPPSSHMRFPGTISVPDSVFSALIMGAAESFRVQGFTNIVLLGDHGGYQHQLAHITDILNQKWHDTPAKVWYIGEYYSAIKNKFIPILKNMGLGTSIGQHADLVDTSLMLAVDASKVRVSSLKSSPYPIVGQGIYGGDPRSATSQLGQIGINNQIEAATSALRTILSHRD